LDAIGDSVASGSGLMDAVRCDSLKGAVLFADVRDQLLNPKKKPPNHQKKHPSLAHRFFYLQLFGALIDRPSAAVDR
jgi:hypothetical protein